MKIKRIIIIGLFVTLFASLFAEDFVEPNISGEVLLSELKKNEYGNVPIDEKTGFPLILKKPFPVFDYGATTSIVTRIIKQEKRSNFVFDDYMLGVYAAMQSRNMEPLDSMIRIAVYYPVAYKFNKIPQFPVNMLNFAIDLFAAPYVNLSLWHYLTFDVGGGLHYLYQKGDRWHYHNLGLGAFARINMPVSRRWSMFVDGYFSLDYGNLGNNARMEPYNFVWQYQVAVGVRYSKKSPNKYSYIPSKRTYEEDIQILANKAQEKKEKKEAKAEEAELKKAQKAEEKRIRDELKAEEKRLKEEQKVIEMSAEEFHDNKESDSNLDEDIMKIESVLNEDVESFDELENQNIILD